MKTFRKKMISLMLVALMLISAMPFAAFADETETTETTEATVEETVTTYDESGSDDYSADYQDGIFKVYPGIKVYCLDSDGVPGDEPFASAEPGSFSISEDYTLEKDKDHAIVRKALSISGVKNAGKYKVTEAVYDAAANVLNINLKIAAHKCSEYSVYVQDGEDEHIVKCSLCGATKTLAHRFVKIASKNADYHDAKCADCGYVKTVEHAGKDFYKSISSSVAKGTVVNPNVDGGVVSNDDDEGNGGSGASSNVEKVKVVTAARDASCTKRAAYAKITYVDCGYTIGGEEYGELEAHQYDSNGKCVKCGKAQDSEQNYTVNIYVTNGGKTPIIVGECDLTKTELNDLRANIAGAKKILNLMRVSSAWSADDDEDGGVAESVDEADLKAARNAINEYIKSINTYYVDMGVYGSSIDIYMRTNLMDVNSAIAGTRGKVLIIDGESSYERDMTIGRYYFDQIKVTDKNRDLVAMKITKTNKSTRTIYKGNNGSDAKVQDDDITCELIWDANIVTLKFYRHAGGGAMLLETRQIRAGERIDSLPMLDGKTVNWYLPSGEPLQEGRVYDFKDTTVNVYPKTSSGAAGDVYLLVYKNGDTKTAVDATPINITQYMQANGLISRADLKKVIENKVKGEKIYLFDYEGWEDYKDTKDTRSSADVFSIGTSSDRGNVFLYAMVTGASTSGSGSSSKADGSNPKTGDNAQLGTAAAVMTVAVIGLGAATVVLKKKEII